VVTDRQHEDGYGTRLVRRTVTGALRGSIEYDWAKEGLVATLKIDPEKLIA
jgi:two-component sensor histidine kinase